MEVEIKERMMKKIVSILTILAVSLNLAYAGTKSSKERDAGWYLRAVVTATTADGSVFSHETAGVFGLLRQSKNKKDRHDIAAYGESGAILQILFTPQDWGEDNGNYFSNYKHYNARKPYKRRVWEFKVRNARSVNLAEAELKIELKGPYGVLYSKKDGNIEYKEVSYKNPENLLSRLTLVDVDNHTTYRYDELFNADLSMDGKHTRLFRWVLGKVKQEDYETF
jgi:hypothetical protein